MAQAPAGFIREKDGTVITFNVLPPDQYLLGLSVVALGAFVMRIVNLLVAVVSLFARGSGADGSNADDCR